MASTEEGAGGLVIRSFLASCTLERLSTCNLPRGGGSSFFLLAGLHLHLLLHTQPDKRNDRKTPLQKKKEKNNNIIIFFNNLRIRPCELALFRYGALPEETLVEMNE